MSASRIEIDAGRRDCLLRWGPAAALAWTLSDGALGATSTAEPGRATGLGIHLHDLANATSLSRLHYSFIRLWDTRTSWRDLQPRRDRWDFTQLDKFVALAQSAGVELVLTLGQTPDWATSNPSAPGPYGAGCSAPPKDLEDWKTYVGTLAQRYKGRVKYWEIWNEANDPKFYSGSLPQLQALAQAARAVLKQVSPMNSVLSPSIQGGALKEFKELANAGVLKACDIASYHFYAPMGTPELAYQRMLKVREILDGAGLSSMPVWNTEVGWLNNVARGGKAAPAAPAWARGWRSLSETDLAAFIVRTALLCRSAGIPVVIWYAWDNGVVGLGGADRGRGSQAVIDAFNLAADTVMKASRVSVNKVGDVWQADIEGRDGTLKAFWVEDGEAAFQVPAGLTAMPGPAPVDRGAAADRASGQRITGTPLFFRPKG